MQGGSGQKREEVVKQEGCAEPRTTCRVRTTFLTAHEIRKGTPAYGPQWWWIMQAMLFYQNKEGTAVANIIAGMEWTEQHDSPV
mmetsp:Transcript_58445/g.143340  ORF Transcript_58445/g.143340 Transcript_58445/m.143340 type:complete len:84 (-) Transcript_58445:237-488(-)